MKWSCKQDIRELRSLEGMDLKNQKNQTNKTAFVNETHYDEPLSSESFAPGTSSRIYDGFPYWKTKDQERFSRPKESTEK